ncbi:STAS domain-containing protein [Phycisphaerales bacterium]|nr:STAS domain-containing protein [Phycisphaerales bacterium]RPG19272.1 MAG: anti-sigma factor antagonist [Phycisphaera sp. TMED9]
MTSGNDMEIQVENRDGSVLVTPIGEVDLARSPSLRSRLAQVLGDSPARLVVDLSQVPYMDSSGVATLVEALQQSRARNCSLFLAGLQDRVRSVFEIARLDTVFTITPDVNSALEA